ncbi:MAG: aldehyde ferredoxin oxidoreductase, partial [Tissierellia bacterium]|nr:aldehyde ferredoxin oxidoreductase [Tissierellia bacterium]
MAKVEPITEELAYEWIGGTGMGVRIVTSEVSPDVQWNEPGNKIVLSAGPLSGTPGIGSGCFGLVTKGAMTGGITQSQANGFFGAFLRSCGYDSIVIEGQSDNWIYIYIEDEKIEFRSAEH